MRTIRFIDPAGSVRTGELVDGRIEFGARTYDPGDVRVLPATDPSKIVCVGLNYRQHADETDSDVPDRPLLFLKPPNALAGHRDTVTLPPGKDRVDYEGELGVVVGEQCRNLAVDDARDVIAGYTCVNDVSNRDDQRVEQNWVRGKAFDNSAPVGPVVATPDHVPDDATIEVRRNGDVEQSASIDDFIFDVPELLAEITDLLTLEPGDVVATGTPAGVGPIGDGDTVEVEVEGVGTLRNDFVSATEPGDVDDADFVPDL